MYVLANEYCLILDVILLLDYETVQLSSNSYYGGPEDIFSDVKCANMCNNCLKNLPPN